MKETKSNYKILAKELNRWRITLKCNRKGGDNLNFVRIGSSYTWTLTHSFVPSP